MKTANNVLYVSHKDKQCGVYQFGYHIGQALKHSKKYNFIYVECASFEDLDQYVKQYEPICTVYNYQSGVMPWLGENRVLSKYNTPQIGMIHEVTQERADAIDNCFFDFYIVPDPTIILKNRFVYKTGRLIVPNDLEKKSDNPIPVIGSFGFGSPGKNFNLLVQRVCDEFEKAVIKLNIPFAKFGDDDGQAAKKIVADCKQIVKKYPGIKLECSHAFLEDPELLAFLNGNSVNAFFYSDNGNRGISSVIDYALSVKVPIAISQSSTMFRHIQQAVPSIVVSDKNGLKEIIKNGTRPLEPFYSEWNAENLIWDYERIVGDVLRRFPRRTMKHRLKILAKRAIKLIKRKLYGDEVSSSGISGWASSIHNYKDNILERKKNYKFVVADIPAEKLTLNRILNNETRSLYKTSIDALFNIIPKWMERKNQRANIQQGFVFDTAVRLSKNIPDPKIISVGSFEDTAYGALEILGYDITGIDPVLNYDLDVYLTKPTTKLDSFDVVFSTSVIEHVEDDLTFLKNMCLLAKKGGHIIFTCDFKEGYKKGDPKPGCDFRFYTKDYLNHLLYNLDDCITVDQPNWDCPDPDFDPGTGDKYTFATVVLKKI